MRVVGSRSESDKITGLYIFTPEFTVRDAAALLLSQSEVLSGRNYEYDVVDVVRQTVADYANILLKQINTAHTEGDKQKRDALADRFLQIILAQDKLVSTIPDFLVGKWIRDARNSGTTTAEKDLYEKNARMIITTWGDRAAANSGGLHDYSYREWGGLLKDFYYPRWKRFFDDLKAEKPTPSADEFFDMEWAWATTPTTTNPYPATAQGDPIAVAKEALNLVSLSLEKTN
jgi:alpha-N-acetylglucosaminidase